MTELSSVPSQLYAPPEGPLLPVETRAQVLPFKELSWKNFERLILRMVRRECEIEDCVLYGTHGQAQEGIDILAVHREQQSSKICYQCKNVVQFGPSDIISAIDKFLAGQWADKAREFVLCVAIPLASKKQQDELDRQRNRLAQKRIKLSVWDGSPAGTLSERLKNSPDLVDDFFGREWVKIFNGHDAAANLKERLNGYELRTLQTRLLKLYSVIFEQHDPGLRIDNKKNVDYRDRYVPADVTEVTEAPIDSTNLPQTADDYGSEISMERGVQRMGMRDQILDHHYPITPEGEGGHGINMRPSFDRLSAYESRRPVFQWLQDHQDCVVLGEPGYGKSTLLRYLALSILQPETTPPDVLNPTYFSCLPVWISFARLTDAVRGSHISVEDFFRDWLHQHSFDDVYPLFLRAVQGKQVLLLLDGLDEAATESSGREALDRVVTFLHSADARIICTSRPRGYKALRVPGVWKSATLTPLNDEKIEMLATRWFSIVESSVGEDDQTDWNVSDQARTRAQAFLHAVQDNPKTLEIARSPLLCQVLIELFRFSHRLPEARVTAYQQIVELLLTRHPAARAQAGGIGQPVEQLGLKVADLKDILIGLAWKLQAHERAGYLSKAQCEQSCMKYLVDDIYGLGLQKVQARRRAPEIIEQLITQYGVLVERAPDEINFVHLSIQEYLVAEWIAQQPPDDQILWLSNNWSNTTWRESLICWFGILGIRDKALSVKASKQLAELGNEGAWQQMHSLELRTEIATADLRFPVGEARKVVAQAAHEVEVSPFSEFRTALARNLTLGALGSSVREECEAAVRRWVPGRSSDIRLRLLQAFKAWDPSDDLRNTLLRAHHDEDVRCQRAASETYAAVFATLEDTLPTLKQLAVHHVQPEVRAAALHGLASRPEWTDSAVEAAEANVGSCNANLLLVVSRIRIRERLQDDTDLNHLWRLWITDSVDFWFRDELTDLLCAGWPQHSKMRELFIHQLNTQQVLSREEIPFEYLIRCYPNDEIVANIFAKHFERFRFSLGSERLWKALYTGYKGHPIVSEILRVMLKERGEKYKAAFWHPRTAPAFAVIGDEDARDYLLASYKETDSLRDRYWIAVTLFTGWSDDEVVRGRIQDWANGTIDTAAPLASWGVDVVPETEQREIWLRKLAAKSVATGELGALMELLHEFPNTQTKQLAVEFLDHSQMWYYHRMTIQSLFARKFPDDPRSLEIVEHSLRDIDGPNPGDFAASFQCNADVAGRLLAAAVTAPRDVRLTVASALRSRSADYETVVALTPEPFVEEASDVRASCLMARARAAHDYLQDTEGLAEALSSELTATGIDGGMRRRSALSGLLELGLPERAVEIFAESERGEWSTELVDHFDIDPVSLSAIIEHWGELQPLLLQHELESELPVDEILFAGYDALLKQTALGREALDNYFETQSPGLINSAYLEALARRPSSRDFLYDQLLKLILNWRLRMGLACTAARLLSQSFSSSTDIWIELSENLKSPEQAAQHLGPGMLGYLVIGWPDGEVASWVRSVSHDQRAQWSPRDRLLIAVALKDVAAAEVAITDMIMEPLKPKHYDMEDIHALRIWSQSEESSSVLARWIESENPSHSLIALSLVVNGYANVTVQADKLLEHFNAQMTPTGTVPLDGLDAATGKHTSWAVGVYSNLNAYLSR